MPCMALTSAEKGRLRPSFFLLLIVTALGSAWAQPVYRCGQQYTNAPADASRCDRLAPQAVTVIEGTRVQGAALPTTAAPATPVPLARVEPASQRQRDDMARTIVAAELEKARQRHAELLQAYQQAQPPRHKDEERPSPQQEAPRLAQLKAAVERAQRDMDSLQRELERRPSTAHTP